MLLHSNLGWTRQPTVPADIDRSLDLAEGLQYSYEPWATSRNSLDRSVAHTVVGGAAKNVGPRGIYYGIDSATSYINTGSGHNTGALSSGTIVVVVYPFTGSYFLGNSSGGGTGWGFGMSAGGAPQLLARGIAFDTCSATTTAQEWQVLGISWRGGVASASSFWKNGAQLGNSYTASTPATDTGNLFLFAYDAASFTACRLAGAFIFNQAKTPKQMAELTANPWQLYKAPKSKTFYSLYTATSDVSLALSGNFATFSGGSLSVTHTNALTGISSTSALGTLGVTHSNALTGQSSTFSRGSFGVTHTNPLTGQSSTFSYGTIVPSTGSGVALTGLDATFSYGTLGVTHTNTLTGNSATFSYGSFSLSSYPATAKLTFKQRTTEFTLTKRTVKWGFE